MNNLLNPTLSGLKKAFLTRGVFGIPQVGSRSFTKRRYNLYRLKT